MNSPKQVLSPSPPTPRCPDVADRWACVMQSVFMFASQSPLVPRCYVVLWMATSDEVPFELPLFFVWLSSLSARDAHNWIFCVSNPAAGERNVCLPASLYGWSGAHPPVLLLPIESNLWHWETFPDTAVCRSLLCCYHISQNVWVCGFWHQRILLLKVLCNNCRRMQLLVV